MLIDRTEGFDLVISEAGGENIRDEPGGRVAGQLVRGARLQEVERVPGWVRVRRTAWIWTPSIELRGDALPSVGRPETSVEVVPRAEARAADEGWLSAGAAGLWVFAAPNGDSIARARPGTDLEVIARQGDWARVRLDGWIWAPDADRAEDAGGPLAELTIPELRADPDRFIGRRLRLELQFISLERAEAVRTDFREGEPFLLMRTRTPDRTFVYVALPPDRIGEFERLVPLESLAIIGRLRRADAAFTGNPVLDLLEFERIR